MAFEQLSLDEITDSLYNDITSNICNGTPSLVSAKLISAISKAVGFGIWATQELSINLGRTPLDATGSLLNSYASLCGVTRNIPQYAGGFVTATGSGTIPVGSIIERCDGLSYEVIKEANVPGQVLVIAQSFGAQYNTPNGSLMTLTSSITGVDPQVIVSDNGIAGGSDTETDESYRARIISCYANPCRTGLASDYDFWARLYNGVTRVCVVPKADGPGTVKIFFAMDDAYANSIPSQQDVENVQEIVDQNVPVGVCATVCAIQPEVIDIDIRLLDGTSSALNQQISEALIEGLKGFDCGQFCYSDIVSIIAQNYGGCFEVVRPSSNFNLTTGQIPVAGTISFVV